MCDRRVEDERAERRCGESLLTGGFRHTPVPQSTSFPRFPSPLIEPDVQVSRIRLSDWLHIRPTETTSGRRVRNQVTPSEPKTWTGANRRVPRDRTL